MFIGTITFNGTGGYTVTNASLVDEVSGSTAPSLFTNTSGTYIVSASGEGYISAVHAYFPKRPDHRAGVSERGVHRQQ
jgi:hypothetical protein